MDPIDRDSDAHCPAWDTLVEFHSGRLSHPEQKAVDTHVAACTVCQTILAELSAEAGDDFLDRLLARLNQGSAPEPQEAGYRAMEAAARAIPFATTISDQVGEATPPPEDLPADPDVGPYRLVAWAGGGGMGVVYRARHRVVTTREAALKMIRTGAHAGPAAVARFRTEAEAVARLQHPNVAQLYEYGEHNGLPYYAMEWVGGGTLASRLADGPLEFREAAEMVQVVARAVAYAHERHVYHRDLKPTNVLLTADRTPKVSDFGLAKLADSEGTGLTATEAVLGTPSYMSPEQASGGTGAVGPPADVWAMGAILYECLTGEPPFRGRSKLETLRLVREADLVPPSARRPRVPADLEAVCVKCLEKDPAKRYPSAQAFADDLGRYLAGEPTAVRPLGRWGKARRVVRKRARAAVLGGLVFGLAAGVPVAIFLFNRPPAPTDPPPAKPDPSERLRAWEAAFAGAEDATLIGVTGEPHGYRWVVGKQRGQAISAEDEPFALHVQGTGVIELRSDPKSDRYRLTCQIRHDETSPLGEVGVYVGRVSYPGKPRDLHFFCQLTFNSVSGIEAPVPDPDGKSPDRRTEVRLSLRLLTEEGRPPRVDEFILGRSGPRIKVLGARNDKWFDLVMIVSPDGIRAGFNGEPLEFPSALIRERTAGLMKVMKNRLPAEPFVNNPQPEFTPRGGLGLVLRNGSASVRNVRFTPLPAAEPVP